MQHVIIGNGPAGAIAAETIRKHKPNDRIILIGDEHEPPYSRMAIPYLLHGNIDEQGTHLRKKDDHFGRLKIDQIVARVKHIDSAAKSIALDNGTTIVYDKLLIATGSVPAKPPIPGIDSPGIYNCWTLADARKIMASAQRGTRVLQMGAGFIGCIILEALAVRGVQLTVVEMGERMVPRMMGEGAGNMIRRWCEAKGITVHTGARVDKIEAIDGGALRVSLSNGMTLEVDVIISATGVKPNIGFVKDSGIPCATGILVDAGMQTSIPGVYAAGDCAEAFDPATGKTVVSAIQPNAAEQARCAGLNMAGHPQVQRGVTQINVLDTLGLISTSFGQWEGVPGGERAELTDVEAYKYIRLEFSGDLLVGANTIGLTEHVGVLRGLIESKVRLGEWKTHLMEDPFRLKEAYIACTQQQDAWLAAAA
ncbi:MAG: NAD(P)/FAD-dependent oxidoreductase [Herminiimonas sp.]|nr:NAD(P)/FAD-dependent oxidoreductase [Herminiimonas sp.]